MEEEITNLKKYVDINERHIAPYGKEICIQAAETKLGGFSGMEFIEHGYELMESGQVEGGKEVTIS